MSVFTPEVAGLLRGAKLAARLDEALRDHALVLPGLRGDHELDGNTQVYLGSCSGKDAERLVAVLVYARLKLAEDRERASRDAAAGAVPAAI
ncbi:hypothetical protein [Saccharothrix sp. ST-888]|uniref:hypothetical protein n=1 Tax=Saccharothrix sp. ST-888 TaxID=1427391 RepID=UPI0005EC677B|nr:hypothetical protein [Saccharothrix sp. ST-888]KJK55861.1 hypothetical protein UK12_26185 [Saccharothrix sp. ST-888]